MKKVFVSILVMSILVFSYSAVADVYEKEILFRGVEWGASFDQVIKKLPDGVKTYDLKEKEYWYPVESSMFDENVWDQAYNGVIGCYTYGKPSTMKNVKVAGYAVDELYLYFIYKTGANGLLTKDKKHTSFYYAYYKLEPKDPEAAFIDLEKKLTSLYGDVDLEQSKSPYISYTQREWYGANNTVVSLVKEDYPSGSHYIYIKYGTLNGDMMMKFAYKALILEETKNAESNTDGL